MACPACAIAEGNPHTSHIQSGCVICQVRQISNAPANIRDTFYRTILDGEERAAFMEAVAIEFRRRREHPQ